MMHKKGEKLNGPCQITLKNFDIPSQTTPEKYRDKLFDKMIKKDAVPLKLDIENKTFMFRVE